MKLLTDCGLAHERNFGDGLTRYELAAGVAHHDHLICRRCHQITEFEEPEIERLQDVVAKRYGWRVESHKHELYGLCPTCVRRES
jgi:Fur family ferric uptake transcriptional regulator